MSTVNCNLELIEPNQGENKSEKCDDQLEMSDG